MAEFIASFADYPADLVLGIVGLVVCTVCGIIIGCEWARVRNGKAKW